MKSIRLVGLLIGLITLLLGCAPSEATVGTEADIRGNITTIHQAEAQRREEGVIGSVLIEGVIQEDTEFDRASVTITDKTRIFEHAGQEHRPVTFESLEIGQRVQARFTGPVMESYPVQATAIEIVILK
jgi:hypothetical protein